MNQNTIRYHYLISSFIYNVYESDGVLKTNDVAPKIVNDRTMLSARFVAENPGAKVDRNGNGYFAKNIIIIS